MKLLYSKNNIKWASLLKKTFKKIIKNENQKNDIIRAITTLLKSKVDLLDLIIDENHKMVIYFMKKGWSSYLEFSIKEKNKDFIFNIIAVAELYIDINEDKAIDILNYLIKN